MSGTKQWDELAKNEAKLRCTPSVQGKQRLGREMDWLKIIIDHAKTKNWMQLAYGSHCSVRRNSDVLNSTYGVCAVYCTCPTCFITGR